MAKIALITEGSPEMGMGHVQQSLTLAQALREKASVVFLTKSDSRVTDQIESFGFHVVKKTSEHEIFAALSELAPSVSIIDRLDVPEDFARRIRETLSTKLAIFSNITQANRYAHISVTADYGSAFKNIRYVDEKTGALYFYGPRYWILREEFYRLRQEGKDFPGAIHKILLIFGGSDPLNVTSAVLDELLNMDKIFQVDVIVGSGFRFLTQLDDVMRSHLAKSQRVRVFRNIRNVAEMMFKADLVMASPGLSLFEALCVGSPAIAIHQNELQAKAYHGFIPTLDKSEISRLTHLIENKEFIDPRDRFIADLKIGEGKEEVIAALLDGML